MQLLEEIGDGSTSVGSAKAVAVTGSVSLADKHARLAKLSLQTQAVRTHEYLDNKTSHSPVTDISFLLIALSSVLFIAHYSTRTSKDQLEDSQ